MKNKKKKKSSKWRRKSTSAYERGPLPAWKQIFYKATQGEGDEPYRAVVAKKAAMMMALKFFAKEMMANLSRCNTNLGLLLDTQHSVVESLVISGTGENGSSEFVPVRLRINFSLDIGPIQDYDEHMESLKTEWMEPDPIAPNPLEQPAQQ